MFSLLNIENKMDSIKPTTSTASSDNRSIDLFTYILSKNLLRSLPHKKLKKKLHVYKLNSDIDLYTNQKIDDITSSKYHLDHIFELQCFAHIISMGLKNIEGDQTGHSTFSLIHDRLKKIMNCDFNLNVTDRQTNLVKMNVFKEFIKRRRNNANSSLIGFLHNSANFNKNIYHFCSTLRKASKCIREQLVIAMNENNSTYNAYKGIVEEFDIFYNSMQIEDYDLIRFL